MKKLLLHVCCAPCASSVIERLKEEGNYNITLFFSNSNILPKEEYEKRKKALEDFISKAHKDITIIYDEYNIEEFLSAIKGVEDKGEGSVRCDNCIYYRLKRTAEAAIKGGFDAFCTTLTVSPHKNALKINALGKQLEKDLGKEYIESDFKKKNGYLRSIQLCREYNIYRQSYCGCNNLIDIVER